MDRVPPRITLTVRRALLRGALRGGGQGRRLAWALSAELGRPAEGTGRGRGAR
jgi:hypothetical protein